MSGQINILLRRVMQADAQKLFEWRNNEEIRESSFESAPLTWEAHETWVRRTLEREDRCLLVGEDDEGPVGVLRYDVIGEVAEISIYIVPGRFGKGLGKALLRAGVDWALGHLSGVKTLRARIRPANFASIRLFEGAGFVEHHRVFDLGLSGITEPNATD